MRRYTLIVTAAFLSFTLVVDASFAQRGGRGGGGRTGGGARPLTQQKNPPVNWELPQAKRLESH